MAVDIKKLVSELELLKTQYDNAQGDVNAIRQAKADKILELGKSLKFAGLTFSQQRYDNIEFFVTGLKKSTVQIEFSGTYSFERDAYDKPELITDDAIRDIIEISGHSQSFSNEILRPDNFRSKLKNIDEDVPFKEQAKNTTNMMNAISNVVDKINNDKKVMKVIADIVKLKLTVYNPDDASKRKSELNKQIKGLIIDIGDALREDVVKTLSKGVTFKPAKIADLWKNYEANKSAIRAISLGTTWSGPDYGFTQDIIGYEDANWTKDFVVAPLLWHKQQERAISCGKIKLLKQNKKSVSVTGSAELKSGTVTLTGTNAHALAARTSYGGRYSDYVLDAEKVKDRGIKDFKTATTLSRLITLALVYDPKLIDQKTIDAINNAQAAIK